MCGLYDPESRILRWSRAGHIPPVLVRDGKASTLPLPNGILLGALPDAEYEEATTVLQLGDTLMLFTDGLVERRGTSMDDALGALLRLAERPADDIEWYADHILNSTAPDTDDDTCLIAVHVH
jgi:serine phosphatase RsbU (regulator of sigma subunit)